MKIHKTLSNNNSNVIQQTAGLRVEKPGIVECYANNSLGFFKSQIIINVTGLRNCIRF